jgi:soluble lytic murein transglycosylase-like protein
MPATARWLDRSLRTEAAILDPANNLRVGFQYLRSLIERYDGNVQLALLAYNRGSGIVDRALRQGRDPENGYTKLVLELNGDQYVGTGLVTLSTSRSQRAPRRRRSVAPDSTRRARA